MEGGTGVNTICLACLQKRWSTRGSASEVQDLYQSPILDKALLSSLGRRQRGQGTSKAILNTSRRAKIPILWARTESWQRGKCTCLSGKKKTYKKTYLRVCYFQTKWAEWVQFLECKSKQDPKFCQFSLLRQFCSYLRKATLFIESFEAKIGGIWKRYLGIYLESEKSYDPSKL